MTLRPSIPLNQYRGSVIVTAPAAEPVTLAELKTHLRITDSADDTYLTAIIVEARAEIEASSGLTLINQTWRMALDQWPSMSGEWWDGVRDGHINMLTGTPSELRLPRFPLSSITSVTVYAEDGTGTAVTVASTFDIDTMQYPGRLTLKRGATWPIALRASNAIVIDYVAGFGATAADVPAPLRRAVRAMAGYLYEHRGDGCDAGQAYVASGAAGIVGRYRVIKL